MRIKIIKDGIFGKNGELPIGTELSVEKAPEGWAGRYIDLDQHMSADDGRDENGDTPEMAELRRMFDTSYERQGKDLTDAKDEVTTLQGTVTDLQNKLATKDSEIATLKAGAGKPAATGPEAKHRGAGSYSIMEGDTEVREKLTKDQAEAFNALDADGKAKWLADNPKPTA